MNSRWAGLYPGTPAELSLEPAVAALGVVYRTNFPLYLWGLDTCFPDFFLPTLGAIIEVDGREHEEPARRRDDEARTARLLALGYKVLRCTNDQALSDPTGTVAHLISYLGALWGLPGAPAGEIERLVAPLVPLWPLPRAPRRRRRRRGQLRGVDRKGVERQTLPAP